MPPRVPKVTKLPKSKSLTPKAFLIKFDTLFRAFHLPMKSPITDADVFLSAARAYKKYNGEIDKLIEDPGSYKWAIIQQ